jgi:sugar diacid utilization regulator
MRLNLPILAYQLSAFKPDFVLFSNATVLVGSRLPGGEKIQDNYVYIAPWNELKQLNKLPVTTICIGGGTDYISLLKRKHCNGLCLPENIGLFSIYNAVNAVFERYNQAEQELLTAIIHGVELNDLLTIGAEIMGNPIWLTDAGLRLVACSDGSKDLADAYGSEMIVTGMSSDQVMSMLKENNMLTLLDTTKTAVFINLPSVAPFYSANIFDGNNRVASLTVHCYKSPPDDCMIFLLNYLTGVLSEVILQRHSVQYMRSTQLQKMFMDMLSGTQFYPKVIEHMLSSLKWNIDDEYQAAIVKMDTRDVDGGVVKYTAGSIRNIFPDSVVIEINNSLLVILHRTGNSRIDETITDTFSKLLSRRNCKAGIGMPFTDISRLAAHYKLASAALEKGEFLNPEKRLYFYPAYIVRHIIDLCSQSLDMTAICHPEAIKIFNYDLKNKTDLLKSLYFYLISEKSLIAASKQLNIHKNTLVYRLQRIADLFAVNLDDPFVRFHLIASYIILALAPLP